MLMLEVSGNREPQSNPSSRRKMPAKGAAKRAANRVQKELGGLLPKKP
jgi:hypothetical protein